MTEPVPLDPKLHNQLTRFVHTGREIPKYYPGCWLSHKYFDEDKLPILNETLQNRANQVEVVEVLLKVSYLLPISFIGVFLKTT